MNAQLIDGIAHESVLAKMHALTLAARNETPPVPPTTGDFTFAQAMDDALRQVSAVQAQARALAEQFTAGQPEINVVDVALAAQKARLSADFAVQVRNRLVSAYQEIMSMPV